MALTAYCKKCKREVPPEELCPVCGTRLGKTAAHAVWCVERKPVKDWMCWNSVMRVLLPAALAVLLIVLAAEGLSGGTEALEALIRGGFLTGLALLLGLVVILTALVLLIQGKELADYVIDSRGVHLTRYLPDPTPLKLLARLKSPAVMERADPEAAVSVVKLEEISLPWREVARVQTWPEKCMILFYAPAWWLRIPVLCTPFAWEDAAEMIREKLGKKKKVRLPESFRAEAPPRPQRVRPRGPAVPGNAAADARQLRMEELIAAAEEPAVPAEDEGKAPPAPPGEETGLPGAAEGGGAPGEEPRGEA